MPQYTSTTGIKKTKYAGESKSIVINQTGISVWESELICSNSRNAATQGRSIIDGHKSESRKGTARRCEGSRNTRVHQICICYTVFRRIMPGPLPRNKDTKLSLCSGSIGQEEGEPSPPAQYRTQRRSPSS